VNCVHASKHSLLCATSRHALMLGSTGAHYGWSDKPSFSVLVKLVRDSGERALRCLRWVKSRHPEIINMREQDTGRTFLQFLLSASSVQLDNVDLFSELLEGHHEVSPLHDHAHRCIAATQAVRTSVHRCRSRLMRSATTC